jgi:ATP-dependent Clp protease ATP-binding subunit ClpB
MTSNLGAGIIQKSSSKLEQAVKNQVWELIRRTFPPEFINRIDAIIMYEPLDQDQLLRIVDNELAKVSARLAKKDLTLKVSPLAKKHLSTAGFDPAYGARPLKRLIQTKVIDPIALMVLERDLSGKTIRVDQKDQDLVVTAS